jgi:hypothetical protein
MAYEEGLFAFNGLVSVIVPGESSSTDPVGATGSTQSDKEGLSTPGKVGISVAALALFLLAVLLVKRRRTTQDDESFAKQINGTTCTVDEEVCIRTKSRSSSSNLHFVASVSQNEATKLSGYAIGASPLIPKKSRHSAARAAFSGLPLAQCNKKSSKLSTPARRCSL